MQEYTEISGSHPAWTVPSSHFLQPVYTTDGKSIQDSAMDHLPMPKIRSGIQPLPRVPYICKGLPYDDGDFVTYPLRAGWPFVLQSEGQLNWLHYEMNQPSDDGRLGSFLQSWLFFGLLHHVLAPAGLYSADDYLVADGEKMYVQTHNLQEKLSSWLDRVRSFTADLKADTLAKLEDCLKLAHLAYRVSILSTHSGFDPIVRLGLAALFEAVEAAGVMANPDMDYLTVAPPLGEAAIQRMREENGWCPAEISAALVDYCSVAGRLYLRHMWKPTLGIDHSSCTSEGCVQTQINLATYQPRHTTGNCSCEHTGPLPDAVDACLGQNNFPLLKIDELGGMEVRPFRPNMAYIALSHVWADGLGNPHSMTLPRCQILKLRSLLIGIRAKTSGFGDERECPEDEELYIWCDSLCCPNKQPGKSYAMAKLRDVYAQSTYVLVLDSTLEFFAFAEIGPLEATVRILTSKWIRRLWTYQEAGLARKLLVQFSDGPIDFRLIWDHVRVDLDTRIAGRYLYRDAAVGGSILRTLFMQAPNLTHRVEDNEFALALRGLSYRRVSVQSDEPLCIAAVLDLDTGAVASEPPGSRMELVWSLMSASKRGIPESMIFNTLPRLTSTGYRWAPATLQQSINGLPYTVVRGERCVKDVLTGRGLRVLRPGWRIRLPGPPSRLPNKFSPATPPEYKLGRWRNTTDGKWYNVMVTKHLLSGDAGLPSLLELLGNARKDWYVVLESNHDQEALSQRCGLLVYRERHDTGLAVYRSAALLQIAVQASEWNVLWEGTHEHAMALRSIWPVRLFAVAWKCEMLLSTIIVWFPGLLRRFTVAMMDNLFPLLAKALLRRIVASIQTRAEVLSKTPRIAAFLRQTDTAASVPTSDVEEIKSFLMPTFMGRVVHVVEEFAPDQEWYID